MFGWGTKPKGPVVWEGHCIHDGQWCEPSQLDRCGLPHCIGGVHWLNQMEIHQHNLCKEARSTAFHPTFCRGGALGGMEPDSWTAQGALVSRASRGPSLVLVGRMVDVLATWWGGDFHKVHWV